MRKLALLLGTAALALCAVASAEVKLYGKYELVKRKGSAEILYVLNFRPDGSTELVTQLLRGRASDIPSRYGIRRYLEDYRRVVHSGRYSQDGINLRLRMDALGGGTGNMRSVSSGETFRGRLGDSRVEFAELDDVFYGEGPFRFVQWSGRYDSVTGGSGGNWGGSGGSWGGSGGSGGSEWDVSVPGRYEGEREAGGLRVRYSLNLSRNGNAEMVIERRRGDVRFNSDQRSAFGQMLDYLDRRDRVRQTGRWTQRGNEVRVDLDRLFADRDYRVQTTLRFDVRRDRLVGTQISDRIYGSRDFNLNKD